MEIHRKQKEQELFERSKLMLNHRPNEVFVMKEVFPHGAQGRMLLNNAFEITEAYGPVLDRMEYAHKEDVLGKTFFDLFAGKEKMRLQHFFEQANFEYLTVLSYIQLRRGKSSSKWISIYGKKEQLKEGSWGYGIVFLDEEDSFATLTTDKFDTLYRSFFDMYESELAQIGLTLRDDVAQELYALRVSMQNFIISNGYEDEISALKKRLNDTIRKITTLSNDLLPNVFVHVGFLPAMEDMIFGVKRLGYDLRYKIDARIADKSPEFQFCCYRVVQALLQSWKVNARPYEASLTITVKGNKININLSESRGVGEESFQHYPESVLHNVHNRIGLYDGTLEVNRVSESSQVLITMYN
ncbi:sensor histidine kinase [Sphingobacterium paucimobilis]|uniref:Signal transduction histidine kinase subgroup 3 dimerisation and phosphoacceptor domain-containing protein n=1 Tax=Sphingobacterium paucimobilis HER1398 TaxID=1346330 RepID=U2HPR0_9SPHI|nr:hypothetical protein [Sphingobacterium paucimobilis]ERJ57275.1 hypothetical protein M472_00700 [Sphingobacterium paucimobilis HER1398]